MIDLNPKYLQTKHKQERHKTLGEQVRKAMQKSPNISQNQLTRQIGRGSNYDIGHYYNYFRRHGLEAEL